MGKLNEVNEQTTQSWGNNSFTTTIKENTVEFDSARDSFTFKDEVNVPSLKIDGTQTEVYTEAEKEKLANIQPSDIPLMKGEGAGSLKSSRFSTVSYSNAKTLGACSTAINVPYVSHHTIKASWSDLSQSYKVEYTPRYLNALVYGDSCGVIMYNNKEYKLTSVEISGFWLYFAINDESGEVPKSSNINFYLPNSQAIGDGSSITGYAGDNEALIANGGQSLVRGENVQAVGQCATAVGYGCYANGAFQNVFGTWNVVDNGEQGQFSKRKYVEIVGNGRGNAALSNARTLDWDGNEQIKGTLRIGSTTTGGVMLKADSGTLKISFDDGATWLTVSAS